ncbi:MAG: leucine--tRNA ligase [Candidatus Cloacimonas sp.]|jgi:leucyl-tRNA synthetase|nr:leucine--tRNA ligase [Candidatus Cloacimonas sp.]
MEYPFGSIERKWQQVWREKRIFNAPQQSDKPKYYVLSMFPYPSGVLHIGHASNYSIGDAVTRLKLMEGRSVMQPMGYDSFGMPAENYAILHNSHPRLTTEENIAAMRKQFDGMGFGLDWDREVSTCRPDYYRWGQYLFKKLYEKGLVYRKKSFQNWCEECQTVLANEQVEEGTCWRCHSAVEQKDLEQWYFKITDYAEELLDFSKVIDWPERVMTMQKNWIGKSAGAKIDFTLQDSETKIPIFTTRPDTIYGVTFMALPPEHPLVQGWLANDPDNAAMHDFCHKVINADKMLRSSADTIKEGIFSGRYCINPLNGAKVQIWITNYVLMDYGTGAVMAVPAHDQRDFDFAKKYNIPMKLVIQNLDTSLNLNTMSEAYTEAGIMANSAQFDGRDSETAKADITAWAAENGWGEQTHTYRLRDWGISRQRYWGNPIPVIHCPKCGVVLVPDADLPVQLPDNVQVGRTTSNPLLSVPEWLNVSCPKCGTAARRETDTMDTFVDSSWYYARYADPKNTDQPFAPELAKHWLPVDQYIGGIEHAVMHLMYARFIYKFMRDLGWVDSDEPFARLLTQGMVTKDGAKMSKSKGNTVDPQYIIDRFGADTLRVFLMFASPPEKDVEWSDDGVMGSFRFLNRVWRLIDSHKDIIRKGLATGNPQKEISAEIAELRYEAHHAIFRWHEDCLSRMQYNTAIASTMELLNAIIRIKMPQTLNAAELAIYAFACAALPKMLYPFAPHIAEELWQDLGNTILLHDSGLPEYNKQYLCRDSITYVVQINGKIRGKLEVSADIDPEALKAQALELENVQRSLDGFSIKKIIVVAGKMVSIAAGK